MISLKLRGSARLGTLTVAAFLLLALGLAACGGSSSNSTGSSEASTEASTETEGSGSVEGKTATIVGCTSAIPYCAKENEVMQKGLEAEGVDVTVLIDELNAAEEAAHINQAVAQGTDAILWVANAQEAAHAPLVKAQQAEVPVVLVGTLPGPTVEGLYTTYVGPSDVKSGELQATMLAEGLEKAGVDSGKIMLVTGAKGAIAVNARLEGWNNAIAKMPQYEVVAEPDGGWDPVKAAQVTQPLFAKYGNELVGASAFSGSMAAATAQTAEQAGLSVGTKKGDVVVAGLNCDGTSIAAVKDGTMYGTTSQGPVSESEVAIKTTVELLEGKEVSDNIEVKNEPIYKSNVAQFEAECSY
jgi:ABC-type sugar transport system substrate-binding protein